ncbi:unnamed protein product [Camellia sinensis]
MSVLSNLGQDGKFWSCCEVVATGLLRSRCVFFAVVAGVYSGDFSWRCSKLLVVFSFFSDAT